MEAIPLPNQAAVKQLEGNTYEVILEPLYPGYGVTIGNALRRVLLSSMPGAAITAVKIKYVDHEFSTVPNVKEDVIQIILNLKLVRLRSFSAEPVRLMLKKKGEGAVTAGDIITNDQVEVISKDQHICTLDNKSSDFEMELIVEQGRGYVPVEARDNKHLEAGMLSIDAIYTPVRAVFFDVTNVRVGQITNFDKLTLNLETDGSITGQEASDIAARILVDHFSMIFDQDNNAQKAPAVIPGATADTETEAENLPGMDESAVAVEAPAAPSNGRSLDEVNLSNRAKNALTKNGINTVESLEALTNDEIMTMAGLGEKTINEIKLLLGRE